MNNTNTITNENRAQIQADYIDSIIEGLDLDSLIAIVRDTLYFELDQVSNNALLEDIQNNAPHLIETHGE